MKLPEKKQRWVYHAEALPQAAGEGVTRRVLAYTRRPDVCRRTPSKRGPWAHCITIPTPRSPMWCRCVRFHGGRRDPHGEAGDTILKEDGVEHGCVCTEAGILLDIFTPMREDFVK